MVSVAKPGPLSRRGLSLPEALISMAITTILLVAVAAAFNSSAQAIESNDTFFRCSQAARVTMDQILSEIRQCDSLDMSQANTISIIRPQQTRQTNEVSRSFVYDTTNHRITLRITNSDGTTTPPATSSPYVLADNVTACTFGPPDMGLDYNNATIPVRVPITLTVSTGTSKIVLNGAAAPRRAMKY